MKRLSSILKKEFRNLKLKHWDLEKNFGFTSLIFGIVF